jgi:hypothetical protein
LEIRELEAVFVLCLEAMTEWDIGFAFCLEEAARELGVGFVVCLEGTERELGVGFVVCLERIVLEGM